MKTYEKYLFAKIAIPMLIITFGITGIAWLSQSLRFIDFIVNKGLSVGVFLYLTTLILPSLFWVVIPVTVFISIIYALHKIYSDSELVVFRASGIDNIELIKPVFKFAILCTFVSYFISLYLLPASYREFKDMQNFIRNNYATILLQEGVFANPVPGVTVYIKERGEDGMFKGMIVHDERDENKKVTMTAQKGYLEDSPEGPVFKLINGSHQELNKENEQMSLLYFTRYNLKLDLFEEKLAGKRWRESQERFIHELFFVDEKNQKLKGKLLAEGHQRITWPLYNILMALLAFIPFIHGQFSRRGNGKKIVIASGFAFILVVCALAVKSLIPKNLYFIAMTYANLLLGFAVAYLFIVKEINPFSNRKKSQLKA